MSTESQYAEHADFNWSTPPIGILTPALDAQQSPPLRGFTVATQGSVNAQFFDGSIGAYPMCFPGSIYPGLILKILSSGTTAGGIVGFR